MINLVTKYGAGFTEPVSAAYPTGSHKNEVTPGVFDGTPLEKAWADDLNAMMQGLLKAAGITASGTTDTVLVSQILQGILYQAQTADFFEDSGAADAYVLAPLTNNYAPVAYKDGQRIRFIPDNTNTGASVVDVSTIGSVDIVDAQGSALVGGELVAGDTVTLQYDAALGDFIMLDTTTVAEGRVVQVVDTQDGEVATGTTVIPKDDSIPQNTEGDEYITLAITPKSTTNKLTIDIVLNLAFSSTGALTAALFQDSTANALSVAVGGRSNTANARTSISFRHVMVSGTVSPITFKVRAGASIAGTTTFNGSAGARLYGGVYASSITITETKA